MMDSSKLSDHNDPNLNGPAFPRLWPSTLPEEDGPRAEGHLVSTKGEFFSYFMKIPDHLPRSLYFFW